MALSQDEIEIHRLVVSAIKRHAGPAVLTASKIAKVIGLGKESEAEYRLSAQSELLHPHHRAVWETSTSLLKLQKGSFRSKQVKRERT